MICAGIDAGSRATKVVLFDRGSNAVLARVMAEQAIDQDRLASDLLEQACREAGVSRAEGVSVVATGYGRKAVRFADTAITEITCHAAGVHFLAPEVATIVEIGGQDCKVICLQNGGGVRDFAMNDRCAAGSGRFLEMLANRLNVSLEGLDGLCQGSVKAVPMSSMCVVFAETEVIGLLSQGVPVAEIAAGVQSAIATRVASLAAPLLSQPACFTGGVALQAGMVRALETALGCALKVPPWPQFTGALGAAILAGKLTSQPARSGPG